MVSDKSNQSMDEICILIDGTGELDDLGNLRVTDETATECFCSELAVHSAEFHAAGTRGIKPECVLVVYTDEYGGQTVVQFGGVEYEVYKTYPRPDEKTELTLRLR